MCAFVFSLIGIIIVMITINPNFCHGEALVAVADGSSRRSELHAAAAAAAAASVTSRFTHFLNAHSTLATRGSLGLAAPTLEYLWLFFLDELTLSQFKHEVLFSNLDFFSVLFFFVFSLSS